MLAIRKQLQHQVLLQVYTRSVRVCGVGHSNGAQICMGYTIKEISLNILAARTQKNTIQEWWLSMFINYWQNSQHVEPTIVRVNRSISARSRLLNGLCLQERSKALHGPPPQWHQRWAYSVPCQHLVQHAAKWEPVSRAVIFHIFPENFRSHVAMCTTTKKKQNTDAKRMNTIYLERKVVDGCNNSFSSKIAAHAKQLNFEIFEIWNRDCLLKVESLEIFVIEKKTENYSRVARWPSQRPVCQNNRYQGSWWLSCYQSYKQALSTWQ